MSNPGPNWHGPTHDPGHHDNVPYWKRAHRDWRIWVGVLLMFAAMSVYVMSGNLAWRPHFRSHEAASGVLGR
jgi:hypothetical protein